VRLSAVGDICHTLPVVRTIQKVWPTTRLTWVIGRLEASLVGDIPNINFVIFDKSKGTAAYTQLYRHMRHRSFDALLHMQMSIRSSLVNRLIPSRIRLGFDRPRAKDLQWLFNNAQIPSHKNQHVIDSFFGFTEALGIDQKFLEWDIPLMDSHLHFTEQYIDSNRPYLVISPCSAMSYRNWNAQGYAAICDYVSSKGVQPILTGGPSEVENTLGEQICTLATEPVTNLIGKTNLKQLLATLKSAIAVISPDSGPAHMATAVNTPVI
jgi:heptosyltransferase I